MGEKLTMQERFKLIFMFGRDGVTYRSVAEEFNHTHAEREKPLNHTTVFRLIKAFKKQVHLLTARDVVDERV